MRKMLKKAISLLACGAIAISMAAGVSAGWKQTSGKWWYEKADKSYPTSTFEKIDSTWYLFDDSGYIKTGWQESGGKWYYFNDSGAMKTGWQELGKKWYYFNDSGAMFTGTTTIGGKKYTFDSNGIWDGKTTTGSTSSGSGSSSGTSTGQTVYWAPTGTKYHSTSGCRTLEGEVYSGTIQEAENAGRDSWCKVCS